MKKIKLLIFTIITIVFATSVEAITIEKKWVQEETPITGDFISYQELFTIGNDVVAIGNTGWDEGHNIARYDTDGNKLWSVETDSYSSFRVNGENLEGIYSSSNLLIIDSYDKSGEYNNLTNIQYDNTSYRDRFIAIEGKKYLFEFKYSSEIIKLHELDNDGEIINTYEYTLNYSSHRSPIKIKNYNGKIYFNFWNNSGFEFMFYFDIYENKFSNEIIIPNGNDSLPNNGLVNVSLGSKYEYTDFYYGYEENNYFLVDNSNLSITIDNYFVNKGLYYKDGYYYISGFDLDGAILYKLDENLELVWTYRYDSEEEFSTLKNMVELKKYIFVLYETEIPNGEVYHSPVSQERYNSIVVLDSNGNLVMEYALDSEELLGSEFHKIVESDDGFIIAGETYSEENKANAIIGEFSIVFDIKTKTDGNGTIKTSVTTEHSGKEVVFEIIPKEGYVLGEVKVTDENGNVVIFTDYTFTMPNANVLIEATFVPIKEEINPETSDVVIIFCIIIMVITGFINFYTVRKKIN